MRSGAIASAREATSRMKSSFFLGMSTSVTHSGQ